jgi:hypothetical protein
MMERDSAPRSVGGGRRIALRAGLRVSWTPPNKRMHATADTTDVMLRDRLGAARDARR